MDGVYKRGDIWYVDYYVDGKRKRERVGTSKRQAEEVLAKHKVAIVENKYFDIRDREKVTFDELAKDYLELHSKLNKKPRVAKRDEGLIKNLSVDFSGKYLNEITPLMIERYKERRSRERKPATVNRELACLKHMFNKAIAWDKYWDNPVRKVRLFKENNQRKVYLEMEQIPRLVDACSPHLKPIVTIAVFTGMRKSEILNLQWKYVDLVHGIIYLLDTKNNERREVLMNDIVKKALQEIPKHKGSPYVFCHKDGKPYLNVRKSFDAALEKCGIINFHFHDLRHTFASQLVMMGVDIRTVQELMGHKTIEMTLRYSHLSQPHKQAAVDDLCKNVVTIWSQTAKSEEVSKDTEDSNSLQNKQLHK